MKLIKTYFQTLWLSSTSLEYYRRLPGTDFSRPFAFFIVSVSLFALLIALRLSQTTLLPLKQLLPLIPHNLSQILPPDLVITIDRGEAYLNQDQPYRLPLEKFDEILDTLQRQIKGITTSRPVYLLVVDPEASIEDFRAHQTIILLTRRHLAFYNQDGRVEFIPLSDLGHLEISRAQAELLLAQFSPFLVSLYPLIVILISLGLLVGLPLALFSFALGYTLFVYLANRLIQLNWDYLSCLKLVLSLLVPLLFLAGILSQLNLEPGQPHFYLLVLSLISLTLLLSLKLSTIPA